MFNNIRGTVTNIIQYSSNIVQEKLIFYFIYLLRATVRMEWIKFNICAFAVGGSPKPWDGDLALHPTVKQEHKIKCYIFIKNIQYKLKVPTCYRLGHVYLLFTRKRSSCRMHTAFKHSKEASNKFHKVKVMLCPFKIYKIISMITLWQRTVKYYQKLGINCRQLLLCRLKQLSIK